jgi:hypothetical protein
MCMKAGARMGPKTLLRTFLRQRPDVFALDANFEHVCWVADDGKPACGPPPRPKAPPVMAPPPLQQQQRHAPQRFPPAALTPAMLTHIPPQPGFRAAAHGRGGRSRSRTRSPVRSRTRSRTRSRSPDDAKRRRYDHSPGAARGHGHAAPAPYHEQRLPSAPAPAPLGEWCCVSCGAHNTERHGTACRRCPWQLKSMPVPLQPHLKMAARLALMSRLRARLVRAPMRTMPLHELCVAAADDVPRCVADAFGTLPCYLEGHRAEFTVWRQERNGPLLVRCNWSPAGPG